VVALACRAADGQRVGERDALEAIALAFNLVVAQQVGEGAAGEQQRHRDHRDERGDQVCAEGGEG